MTLSQVLSGGGVKTNITYHKALSWDFHSLILAKSDRQQWHFSILTKYIGDFRHIRGDQNIIAYYMSGPVWVVQIDASDLLINQKMVHDF